MLVNPSEWPEYPKTKLLDSFGSLEVHGFIEVYPKMMIKDNLKTITSGSVLHTFQQWKQEKNRLLTEAETGSWL